MERWTLLWILAFVLLLVGGLLLFVPVVPSGTQTVTPPKLASEDQWYIYEVNVTAFSVTGSVPFTLFWSSTSSLYLDYATCRMPQSSFSGFFNGQSNESGCSEIYGLSGASNNPALTVSVPAGGSIILGWGLFHYGPASVSISYATWTGVTWVSPILLIAGVVAIFRGRADWIENEKLVAKRILEASQRAPEWRWRG